MGNLSPQTIKKPRWQQAPIVGSPSDVAAQHTAPTAQVNVEDLDALALSPPRADGGANPAVALRAALPSVDVPEIHPRRDKFIRGQRIGIQGVGAGFAGLAGTPVNLAELALNSGSFLAEKGINGARALFGADGVELPRFNNSVGGSQNISNVAGDLIRALAGEDAIIPESDMTPDERISKLITQFGTEALVGGSALSKAAQFKPGASLLADAVPDVLKAPFKTKGSVARVLAGDVAAGAGSGAALGTFREKAPEVAQGPLGEIITGLLGGVGGANLARAAKVPKSIVSTLDGRRNVPTAGIPLDPDTALPTTRKVRDQAARSLQDQAIDPAAAARIIDETAIAIGPGVQPTTGVMSNDPGLLGAERQLRTSELAPQFIQRDRQVMDSVSERVNEVRPTNGNPAFARTEARSQNQNAIDAANANADEASRLKAISDTGLEEQAADVNMGRSLDQASRDLDRNIVDETFIPERTRKNELFDAAKDSDAVVSPEATRTAAAERLDIIERQDASLRDTKSASVAKSFAERGDEARPLRDALEDRTALSARESEARAKGDFGQADTMRAVRKGINDDVRAAAESGVPGTEKLAKADANFRERFAPFFRDGNASPDFFKSIDKDPGRAATPPEATARRFLLAGPTSRAAAKDVADILSISPNKAEGLAAAQDYVLADAVGKGIIKNGRISETRLAKFISQREGMFSALPSVKAKFDDLLRNVRSGNTENNRLAMNLAEAQKTAKLTQRQIDQGALKLVADFEPSKAVKGVFNRPNPAGAMEDIVKSLGNNPEAVRGWKASVSDYLANKVTTASRAGVSEGHDTVSLPALTRVFKDNIDTLAKVFTPDEMASLQQAHKRLEALSRRGAQASTGSATGENLGGIQGLIRAFAQPIGTAFAVTKGVLLGGSVERRVKMVADMFPGNNPASQKLIARAMFDPKIAKHLLSMPLQEKQMVTWGTRLNQLLVASEAGSESGAE